MVREHATASGKMQHGLHVPIGPDRSFLGITSGKQAFNGTLKDIVAVDGMHGRAVFSRQHANFFVP
jgi:hypothetical protein